MRFKYSYWSGFLKTYVAKLIVAFFIFLICIISGALGYQPGQNTIAQNLKLLSTPLSDTVRVQVLREIASQYRGQDFNLAKKYLHEAINFADEVQYTKAIPELYNLLGIFCRETTEYDSAIFYHLKSLKYYEQMPFDQNLGNTYNDLAIVYTMLRDSSNAIGYLLKSLQISTRLNDLPAISRINTNIGNLMCEFNHTDIARTYFYKSLDYYQKSGDMENLAKTYNNIGGAFYNDNNYRKALYYFIKSAGLKKTLEDNKSLAEDYYNIGATYLTLNRDSAEYYFKEAMFLAKNTGSPLTLMEIYSGLIDLYKMNNDYKKAYESFDAYVLLKDSLFTKEKAKTIAEIQTKYETEKKEQQIKLLTRNHLTENKFKYALFVALSFLLVIVIVLFNRYRFELQTNKVIGAEKQRSEELLRNILPQETADELKKYGKTTARNYDEVSVMFADVKGFTRIAENMTAEALVADLDMYFGNFDGIMERFGLEKIKTIGDAYLCAGGMPDPARGTPQQTIMAALEMQKYVTTVMEEKKQKNEPYFEIRIGIHTGPLVAGVVGIKKFAYDIWGDTVNTAARMEQYSEPGKVNISDFTYQKIKDNFNCTPRGEMEVKNKGMVAMYFVNSAIIDS